VYENLMLVVLLALFVVVAAAYYVGVPWPLTTTTERTIVKGSAMRVDVAGIQEARVEKPGRILPGSTRAEATQALFERWQIEYRLEGGTVCDQARVQGLRCEEGTGGSLSALQKANRPVVLKLVDQEGRDGYALLTALDGTTATCMVGNDTRTSDVSVIARQWSGEYLLLSVTPSDYKEKLKPGRRGPPVAWLDRQLALAQNRPARTGREHVYDQEMVTQVKAFQRTAGLTPDGVAGLRTILALTSAVGDGGPTLRDGKASN
jgi:general secretion pathway protein A